jgi:hypothetical protein
MGLLSRLRDWLTGSDGGAPGEEPGATPESGDPSDEPRLDPDNVTKARTEAESDPAEKLRELKDDGEGDGSG